MNTVVETSKKLIFDPPHENIKKPAANYHPVSTIKLRLPYLSQIDADHTQWHCFFTCNADLYGSRFKRPLQP